MTEKSKTGSKIIENNKPPGLSSNINIEKWRYTKMSEIWNNQCVIAYSLNGNILGKYVHKNKLGKQIES